MLVCNSPSVHRAALQLWVGAARLRDVGVSLRVIAGPLAGEEIVIERELVIGRQDADVVIDDPELSRRHLLVRLDGDVLTVEDLRSTNGTLVDDVAIDGPVHVADGATVKLGMTVLEVVASPAPQADGDLTQVHQEPSDLTRVAVVPVLEEAPPAPVPERAPAAVEPVAETQQLGAFKAPSGRRGRGLASRSWIPVALSYGSAICTAVALVIYFAQR